MGPEAEAMLVLFLLFVYTPIPAAAAGSVLAVLVAWEWASHAHRGIRSVVGGLLGVGVLLGVAAYLGRPIHMSGGFLPVGGSSSRYVYSSPEPFGSPWFRVFLALNLYLYGAVPGKAAISAWLQKRTLRAGVLGLVALPLLVYSLEVVVDGFVR